MHLPHFAVFWGLLRLRCCKTVANFQKASSPCAASGTEIFSGQGLFWSPKSSCRQSKKRRCRVFAALSFLCTDSQGIPDLLRGLGPPGTPVIVGIDLQRHAYGAVSRQILDLLDVQTCLEESGNEGVPQNVRGDVRIRQLPLDQPPHAPVRRSLPAASRCGVQSAEKSWPGHSVPCSAGSGSPPSSAAPSPGSSSAYCSPENGQPVHFPAPP